MAKFVVTSLVLTVFLSISQAAFAQSNSSNNQGVSHNRERSGESICAHGGWIPNPFDLGPLDI